MTANGHIDLLQVLRRRAATDIVVHEHEQNFAVAELLARTARLSSCLAQANLQNIALLAGNSVSWIVVDLACQADGRCLIPLPSFFSDGQLRSSLQAAGVDGIITDDSQRVRRLIGEQCEFSAVPGCNQLVLARLPRHADAAVPAATAKITFTSGSTGEPKGVCLSLTQQLRVAQSVCRATGLDRPHHLCLLPLSTLLENVGGVYSALLAGGEVTVLSPAQVGFSGSGGLDTPLIAKALDLHRPSSIILLPQMLLGLVVLMRSGWHPPAELQFVAVGGARVAPELIREARCYGLPVYEGYGLSEVASVACLNIPGRDKPGSVGTPLAHTELSCEAGEIILHGNAFLGYLGQPETWHAKSFATGDLGKIDADGFCHIVGRRKNLLISGFGRNISPEWPESEVLGAADIAHCVVFGDDRPFCVALIETRSGQDDAYVQSILDKANRNLPDYAQVRAWRQLPAAAASDDRYFTANGRPRREAMAHDFAALIESMYVQPCESAYPKEASCELF